MSTCGKCAFFHYDKYTGTGTCGRGERDNPYSNQGGCYSWVPIPKDEEDDDKDDGDN